MNRSIQRKRLILQLLLAPEEFTGSSTAIFGHEHFSPLLLFILRVVSCVDFVVDESFGLEHLSVDCKFIYVLISSYFSVPLSDSLLLCLYVYVSLFCPSLSIPVFLFLDQ